MNSNPYMNIHSIQLHIDELKPLYEYSFNPIIPHLNKYLTCTPTTFQMAIRNTITN